MRVSPGFVTTSWADWSCAVRVSLLDPAALAPAKRDVHALMQEVELAASRFLPGSELNRANWLAGMPVPVSRMLTELVGVALDAAAETDGAVDPTVGLDLLAAGYDRDIAEVRGRAASARAASASADPGGGPARPRMRPDWSAVWLDRGAGLLRVPHGAALDLGATAKAWTADRAATAIARRYGTAALVEIGGDLAVAGAPDGGWRVHVAERADGYGRTTGQDVGVHAGGVATSTTTVRAWQRGERTLHHLIDPATGAPARGPWRTVTVADSSALAANVASTAAIVLGDGAEQWLRERGAPARLVHRGGYIRLVGAWPTDDLLAA